MSLAMCQIRLDMVTEQLSNMTSLFGNCTERVLSLVDLIQVSSRPEKFPDFIIEAKSEVTEAQLEIPEIFDGIKADSLKAEGLECVCEEPPVSLDLEELCPSLEENTLFLRFVILELAALVVIILLIWFLRCCCGNIKKCHKKSGTTVLNFNRKF